jgi:hypothetical protein
MFPLVRRGDLRTTLIAGGSSPGLGTPRAPPNQISKAPAVDESPVPDLSSLCIQFIHSIIEAGLAQKLPGVSETVSDASSTSRTIKFAPGTARRKLFSSKARYLFHFVIL